jgi:hypothetical protein
MAQRLIKRRVRKSRLRRLVVAKALALLGGFLAMLGHLLLKSCERQARTTAQSPLPPRNAEEVLQEYSGDHIEPPGFYVPYLLSRDPHYVVHWSPD